MNKAELRRRLIVSTTKSLNEMGFAMKYGFVLSKPGVEITMSRPKEPKFKPLVIKGESPSEIMRSFALEALNDDDA
ncbi:hypothetical protein D3C87_1637030 [compost metagenome]